MAYLIGKVIGYCLVMLICGSLSLSAANKGKKNPWIAYIVGIVGYVFATIGAFARGADTNQIICLIVAVVIAVFFYFKIKKAQNEYSGTVH